MANQISISGNLQAVVTPAPGQTVSLSAVIAVAGSTFVNSVQSVGTSESSPDLPGVSAPGYVYLKNLDTTNYVEVGAVTAEYAIKLLPGDIALFRVDGTALFWKAHTTACEVQIFAVAT